MSRWLLLQISDSAFPTGGFAHSAGLEAAMSIGGLGSALQLRAFARDSIWQTGLGSLPFVGAAHDAPDGFDAIDLTCDAFLTSHVTNRASRTQGRAWLGACARIFDDARVLGLYGRAVERTIPAHLACAFGATARALGVTRDDALCVFAHQALRTVASAAVRLGIVGPHEAQRLQHELAPVLGEVAAHCAAIGPEDAAQPAPVLEMWGAQHDRLYSRLFQS